MNSSGIFKLIELGDDEPIKSFLISSGVISFPEDNFIPLRFNLFTLTVGADILGDAINFLKENQQVQIAFEDTIVLSVELPPTVNLRVTHTEPGLKGDTATNVLKPATVETGAQVSVPLFVNEGDLIKVDTRTGEYLERVKE